MRFILFLCVFISGLALVWGRCQKFGSGLILMSIRQVGRLLSRSLGVVPVIIFHISAVPVYGDFIAIHASLQPTIRMTEALGNRVF